MLAFPDAKAGQRSELRVVLVVVAVAQRRLGPNSSGMTSTVERARSVFQ
jgi:hypothetical protein